MSNAAWVTVNEHNPCPICEKNSWCSVSRDGTVVVCMRDAGGKPIKFNRTGEIGYLHRLEERVEARPVVRERRDRHEGRRLTPERVGQICSEYRNRLVTGDILDLASRLSVSMESLEALGVGRVRRNVYAFPMCDGNKTTIGIRIRSIDGKKWAESGSRNGVFVPDQMFHEGALYVVEGPTDTAALLTLGCDVVGRPSCSACDDMVAKYCVKRDVVIIADNDKANQHGRYVGLDGAIKLSRCLVRPSATVRIINPIGRKDVREWIKAGGTRDLLECLASNKEPIR